MTLYNDSYACQNQQPDGGATIGKMLGGSGGLDHLIHVTPSKNDFIRWAIAANDSSWGYEKMIKYFVKSENVKDEAVLAQNTSLHGTDGPNDADGNCLINPLLTIGDGKRQEGNVAYLSKAKNRKNLYVLTNASVTKINFNCTMATGVQYKFNGTTYTANATNSVIIAAGAIKTPQLLMLSGVGNTSTLSNLGIETVVDNPHVGQHLKDHLGAIFFIALNNSTVTAPAADPSEFPAQLVVNRAGLNTSSSELDVLEIFLFFPPNSTGLLNLCTNTFKYSDKVCDTFYAINKKKNTLYVTANLMRPMSEGSVNPKTADMKDQPEVKLGLMSNSADLDKFAQRLFQYVGPLLNTTSLQNLGAEFVDLGLCKNHTKFSLEFWKCYIVAMSTTFWHYVSTCAVGKVVDAKFNVMGTANLKIVDASVIPELISGKVGSYVRAVAEKAADIIKIEDGCCST
ncbi:putative ecdysone oxidase [Operophtera brumata]|uniref:Putative ecdysone oxidase n=1 Tax=Operophtera brumata TaxID=104452 RepID=A0A0L7KK78_OPEBR|nr:putative ecdysone oxidase [Operophtera brumata]